MRKQAFQVGDVLNVTGSPLDEVVVLDVTPDFYVIQYHDGSVESISRDELVPSAGVQ
jgi:hypothetical protein